MVEVHSVLEFNAIIGAWSVPVLVEFCSTWNAISLRAQVERMFSDVPIVRVDSDIFERTLLCEYGVRPHTTQPTYLVMFHGREVVRCTPDHIGHMNPMLKVCRNFGKTARADVIRRETAASRE
jgi:hypothetical protein